MKLRPAFEVTVEQYLNAFRMRQLRSGLLCPPLNVDGTRLQHPVTVKRTDDVWCSVKER